jgi:uncharacterized membrane protein
MNAPALPDDGSSEPPAVSFLKPLVASLMTAAALAGWSLWAFGQLSRDARIPTHWNVRGQVDGYAGKSALFLMPAILAGLALLLFTIPKFEPRRGHLQRSAVAYRWIWLVVVAFVAGVQVLIIAAALGRRVAMDRWLVGGLGIVFLIAGNFLGKIRSNFVMGVRTPWTLSSELAWNRTHRLAGWLFVIGGAILLCGVIAGLHGLPLMAILLGWIAVTVAACTVYSYVVWRSDPNRRINGGGDP